MNRQILFFVGTLAALSLQGQPGGSQRPNIVYLMMDKWGYFESGHMSHPDLLTPNIDRFAAEGMRFTNAYAGAPVCGPTRCSLLTGLHSGHMSLRQNDGFSPIRADEPTLASRLRREVYAAFLHMVDRQLGELISLLKKLELDEKTIFFLCGVNGGQDYFKSKDRPHGFYAPNLNPETHERFRAGKGSLYEGELTNKDHREAPHPRNLERRAK